MKIVLRILSYLKPYWRRVTCAYLALFTAVGLQLYIPHVLAGVIAGLVCGIRMRREGRVPDRSFTTIALRGEESAWFGKPYLGSAALLGRLTERTGWRRRSRP